MTENPLDFKIWAFMYVDFGCCPLPSAYKLSFGIAEDSFILLNNQ